MTGLSYYSKRIWSKAPHTTLTLYSSTQHLVLRLHRILDTDLHQSAHATGCVFIFDKVC